MKGVSIKAAGYTWGCPECGSENYIGAAPEWVDCVGCQAQFEVVEKQHRIEDRTVKQIHLFDVGEEDLSKAGGIDEIPF